MEFSTTSHLLSISGVLLLLLLYNLWRVRVKRQNYESNKSLLLAPEPSGALPIIGHLHLLGKENTLARTLGRLADNYGPIFTIWLGVHRTVVVSSYEAIKECFSSNDRILASRPRSSHGQYLSYNYAAFGFASYGPYWSHMRKLVAIQLLSSHRIKLLKHVQISEVNTLIKELYEKQGSNKKIINISECFEHLTLNMITRMIAGPVKTMKRLSRELDSLTETWIDEHKLKRVKSEESKNMEEDFIDVMLSLLEDDFFGHSKEDIIKGTVTNLIIAGADTTSITLTWILSNLLNNRRTLELAQQELDLKVGRNRCVQDSDIDNLVYLNAIVKETLRLYPPGPLAVPHEASEDCSIAGYHIPKGTRVFANLWKLHRDPNVWSSPIEFVPERFLTSQANMDVSGQNFEYIPFGSGRRSCPGLNFAIQAIHLTLAKLLQAFSFTTPLNVPVDMTEGLGITLPKATPLEIHIIPRLSPELYAW
ncbi:xanthotoxin 5-hydroxylase CYP82C4 isoform X2 [Ricinus communis]|uniref:xanthotoxin 5-hydroxylase CYP82C4 isoform X2 n=1 Tax=Ricinus communis TaxID=3988 RepID=UPI00201AB4DE|nr:xanthotoxin 5-hydroxylase CYP82C4 isoform X2 [Ricinus communis]